MEEHKYLTKYKKLRQQILFKDTEMRLAQGNSAVCLSFFFFFWPCHAACGILVPQPGIKPVTPALKVLTTGPQGKSLTCLCIHGAKTQPGSQKANLKQGKGRKIMFNKTSLEMAEKDLEFLLWPSEALPVLTWS